MSQFRQKPAHAKHHRPARPGIRKPLFSFSIFKKSFPRKSAGFATENAAAFEGQRVSRRPETRKSAGFSFPIPSLMTLAVIAGTLVISLIALNWEGLPLESPRSYALQPAADAEGQRNLASYAGVPSFGLPETVAVTPEAEPASETVAGATPEKVSDTPEASKTVSVTDPIPLDLMETFQWTDYKVRKGDSVSKIASQFGVSMDAVIASNDIKNARRLREGETLRIPNMDGIPYTVKKGDNLSKIAKTYAVPLEVILDTNDIRSDIITEGQTLFIPGARLPKDALRLVLGDLFIYPVGKKVTSYYGWRISPITGERHFHAALDFAASTGTPVKAAMDATVATVSVDWQYGNYIILSHAGGYQTLYGHLSKFSVKQGDRVRQGEKIGEAGSTGKSTGPHLHFVVFKNSKAVDPLDLLP